MSRSRPEKTLRITVARTSAQVKRCHPVMRELRPHCKRPQDFVERVRRQQRQGYLLAFLEADGQVQAVAGYRYGESLFAGRFLYVDDLVTAEGARSRGYGGQLLDWLLAEAQAHGCEQLELDSGVQRFEAHRFYFAKQMKIAAYHFSIPTKIQPRR